MWIVIAVVVVVVVVVDAARADLPSDCAVTHEIDDDHDYDNDNEKSDSLESMSRLQALW